MTALMHDGLVGDDTAAAVSVAIPRAPARLFAGASVTAGPVFGDAAAPVTALCPLDDDLAVLSRHGRSFRLAGRLLGRAQFERATALYAACRAADDLADESPDQTAAAAALEAIHRDLAGGDGSATQLGSRFRRLGVGTATAALLVRTMVSDLGPVRIADEAALLRYANGVAGTVGLMMCDVLGIADPAARRHATELGIAMQLTNIARDVREDAARDRIYLPADWLPPGTTPDTLADDPVSVFVAVRRLLMLAERFYDTGARGYPALPGRARLAIPVAAALYRHIGRQVLHAGPAFLHRPRIVVSPLTRARLVVVTVAAQRMGPGSRD